MDPISLILSALASGAAQGVADSASSAVKDAYSSLKRILAGRFANNKSAEVALAEHAEDPQTLQHLGQGPDRVRSRRRPCGDRRRSAKLMALLDAAGSRAGKYHVDLRGASGVQLGDGNQQVVNFFGSVPSKPDTTIGG